MKFPFSYIHTIIKIIIPFIILSISSAGNAQETFDSAVNVDFDTTNYFNGDTGVEKHSYDSSQKFFNQKDYNDEAYVDEKINQHYSTKTIADSFRNADDFWYVKAIENFKANEARLRTDPAYRDSLIKEGILQNDEQIIPQQKNNFTYKPWFKTIIWIVIIGIFLFGVIYFLMANKISFFSSSNPAANRGDASNKISEVNIFQLPYKDLLHKAYTEKNYRLAVRILYLQTLKLMNERAIIQFQPEYTNLYYLEQLHTTVYYDLFSTVTGNYEYIWYGKFEIAEAVFTRIKQDFESLHNKLG